MPNIALSEQWLQVLVSIGVVVGSVVFGLYRASRPANQKLSDDVPVQAAGFLFDAKSVQEMTAALWSIDSTLSEGMKAIIEGMQAKRDAEHMDLLHDILEKLPDKPGRRPPQR